MVPTEQQSIEVSAWPSRRKSMYAPLEVTFESLLEQIGPANEVDGPMPMIIEPWPGGRWYRDLGNNNGHLWAHVQAIKRPTLLEFSGPLFASYPLVNNVQYRLTESNGGTLITFRHTAFGFIQPEHREGVRGLDKINDEARQRAVGAFAR